MGGKTGVKMRDAKAVSVYFVKMAFMFLTIEVTPARISSVFMQQKILSAICPLTVCESVLRLYRHRSAFDGPEIVLKLQKRAKKTYILCLSFRAYSS